MLQDPIAVLASLINVFIEFPPIENIEAVFVDDDAFEAAGVGFGSQETGGEGLGGSLGRGKRAIALESVFAEEEEEEAGESEAGSGGGDDGGGDVAGAAIALFGGLGRGLKGGGWRGVWESGGGDGGEEDLDVLRRGWS